MDSWNWKEHIGLILGAASIIFIATRRVAFLNGYMRGRLSRMEASRLRQPIDQGTPAEAKGAPTRSGERPGAVRALIAASDVYVIALLAFGMAFISDPWLPLERVNIQGDSKAHIGYVLNVNGRTALFAAKICVKTSSLATVSILPAITILQDSADEYPKCSDRG